MLPDEQPGQLDALNSCGKQTIIGSDNGLSPSRRQAIIWTNAGILLIGPLGTNFSEISIKILTFSFTKMRLKVSSAKWRRSCLGLNVLNRRPHPNDHITCIKLKSLEKMLRNFAIFKLAKGQPESGNPVAPGNFLLALWSPLGPVLVITLIYIPDTFPAQHLTQLPRQDCHHLESVLSSTISDAH